jgi:hypothetical protein
LITLRTDSTTDNVVFQAVWIVWIALFVWILVYLAKPEIKALFREQEQVEREKGAGSK